MKLRAIWMSATFAVLGVMIYLAYESSLSIVVASAMIVAASDQIYTKIKYKGVTERFSLMYPTMMVTILYLPAWQAAMAFLWGFLGAYAAQAVFENRSFLKTVVNAGSTFLGAVAALLTYHGIEGAFSAVWPSLASLFAISMSGVAFELVSYLALALAWMRYAGVTLKDAWFIWMRSWWYPAISITMAVTLGLIIEKNIWALPALLMAALIGLKPSYEIKMCKEVE